MQQFQNELGRTLERIVTALGYEGCLQTIGHLLLRCQVMGNDGKPMLCAQHALEKAE